MGLLKEIQFAISASGINGEVKKVVTAEDKNFVTRFEEMADKNKNNEAIVFEGESWTYAQLEERANRYAHWVQEQNIGSGQVLALLMQNRSEYIAAWLGILKSGNTASLINNNLSGKALAHSINVCNTKHVVLGAEVAENYIEIKDDLENKPTCWVQDGAMQGMENLDEALAKQQSTRPNKPLKHEADALYIYTSGTTGNPKAAKISHRRLMVMGWMFASTLKSKPKDRNYIALPLYHSAGGICAVGSSLLSGGTIVLKRRFSVKDFWQDIYDHKVTQFQYIGEFCRYLVNAPEHLLESKHNIRIIIGNGLRPEVWETFQPRFKIPKIIEFYGATEGNISLVNFDGKVGAVGRIPKWARKKSNIEIVKFDVENEEPVRDDKGLCIPCQPDEIGELIGQIFYNNPDMPSARFEGYVGKKETSKKILCDVFENGDEWFRSGDLMKFDKEGYFYFIDRIGDTFRWKGENVATSEVAEAITIFNGVEEVNVYGVKVGDADGRAGMASIVADSSIDLKKLHEHIGKNLPSYAQPLFLRVQEKIEITGTFKHRKVELVKEGFDPAQINEPLYFNDTAAGAFVPLDSALYQKIMAKEIRL